MDEIPVSGEVRLFHKQPPSALGLLEKFPLEIRNEIYSLLLKHVYWVGRKIDPWTPRIESADPVHADLNVLRLSSTIFREASEILYNDGNFTTDIRTYKSSAHFSSLSANTHRMQNLRLHIRPTIYDYRWTNRDFKQLQKKYHIPAEASKEVDIVRRTCVVAVPLDINLVREVERQPLEHWVPFYAGVLKHLTDFKILSVQIYPALRHFDGIRELLGFSTEFDSLHTFSRLLGRELETSLGCCTTTIGSLVHSVDCLCLKFCPQEAQQKTAKQEKPADVSQLAEAIASEGAVEGKKT